MSGQELVRWSVSILLCHPVICIGGGGGLWTFILFYILPDTYYFVG